jgi:hypothetical protein
MRLSNKSNIAKTEFIEMKVQEKLINKNNSKIFGQKNGIYFYFIKYYFYLLYIYFNFS